MPSEDSASTAHTVYSTPALSTITTVISTSPTGYSTYSISVVQYYCKYYLVLCTSTKIKLILDLICKYVCATAELTGWNPWDFKRDILNSYTI